MEPMELAVIIAIDFSNHHRRSHVGIELGIFQSKAQRLNHSATDPNNDSNLVLLQDKLKLSNHQLMK